MLYIAHRGACSHHPENSLAAIELALKQDFDGVEFDVRSSKDRKLYLMHDKSLFRTTNARGKLSKKLGHQIRHVSLRNNERLPALEDALKIVKRYPRGKLLFLEIKEAGYERKILGLIKKYGVYNQTIISSWSRDVLENIRKSDKNIRMELETFLPLSADLKFAKRTKCWSICFEAIFLRKRLLSELRQYKIKPFITFSVFDYGIKSARKTSVYGMFVESI